MCVSQTTLATVLPVVVEGHKDTSTVLSSRAVATKMLNLSLAINLVVLQDGHLDLLALVLDLLGSVVSLLLSLLSCKRRTKWRVDSFWML